MTAENKTITMLMQLRIVFLCLVNNDLEHDEFNRTSNSIRFVLCDYSTKLNGIDIKDANNNEKITPTQYFNSKINVHTAKNARGNWLVEEKDDKTPLTSN
ncbi:1231_t:CDS:2 [Entrophospora sp. SA101]|nr:1231_t:CDS:2 [Entrophospora sp. SA101]